jgi:hypothetical protein
MLKPETFAVRQQPGKQVSAATDDELLEMMFSIRSVQSGYKRRAMRFSSVECSWLCKGDSEERGIQFS